MGKGDYLAEFEQVVLLALARIGEDAYGMTIHDEILRTTGRDVAIPSVYITLSRLQDKGYVSSRTGEPTAKRGGRAKKYYRLEPLGVGALERSRHLLDQLWDGPAGRFARAYVVLVAALFLLFLPLLTAFPVPHDLWAFRFPWGAGLWTWFPTWI